MTSENTLEKTLEKSLEKPTALLPRQHTAIDILSEQFLENYARYDPIKATELGITTYDHLLPDYSPDGLECFIASVNEATSTLANLTPVDIIDAASKDILSRQLKNFREYYDAGLAHGPLDVIESPLHSILSNFDLLNLASDQGSASALARLESIPQAISGYIVSLQLRNQQKLFPFRTLQLHCAINAASQHPHKIAQLKDRCPAFRDKYYDRYHAAMEKIFATYQNLEQQLIDLLPNSTAENAVGSDAYAIFSHKFLGQTLDFTHMYQWGQEYLAETIEQQKIVSTHIVSNGSIEAAYAALDNDPAYRIIGTSAFTRWMQETSDAAVAVLKDKYFDIPPELVNLECKIALSGSGAIYYTAPTEDFSRPGTMWWAVPEDPEDTSTFYTWSERTVVYHEGVPGHHLQLGSAMLSPDLNRLRKLASFVSGHGEGWALYAETLMDELGLLPTPGDRLGMLNAQRFRAARVILDIGYHCGFPAPASVGGGKWDYPKAWAFLREHMVGSDQFVRFELHRYLGWPGQAPSYAIGLKLWNELRKDYQQKFPHSTPKDFHRRALALGGIGLADLRKYVLAQPVPTVPHGTS